HLRARHVPLLGMAGKQTEVGAKGRALLVARIYNFWLFLHNFVVENPSLPDELQKILDQRISMNMLGDMNRYTQFQVAQSMPIAAANEGGGGAGLGAGLGVGMGMAQTMMGAMRPGAGGGEPPAPAGAAAGGAAPGGGT